MMHLPHFDQFFLLNSLFHTDFTLFFQEVTFCSLFYELVIILETV
jgi:hypothetical protein